MKEVQLQELISMDYNPMNIVHNAFNGPNLSSVDPVTNAVVHLFHPRIDDWKEHFALVEGSIVGLTPKGRATVRLLCMNAPRRVQLRKEWAKEQKDW